MADLKISDLTSAANIQSTDLVVISQDQGGGSWLSKSVTGANFDMVKGIRYYGSSATDPVSPTPADGDEYYNTALDMKMYYDGGRSKWLSIDSVTIFFARNGNTAAGTYYRASDGLSYSAADGFYAPHNGTVVGLGYTRTDTDSATFEVTNDGASLATLASTALQGASTTLDANFASTDVIGVRNQAGGNITSNVAGWVKIRWRI